MEEDYEQELYGIEDDFHSQFAAELEVLAELEGNAALPSPPVPRPKIPQAQMTFEEAIAAGDAAALGSADGAPRHRSKRQLTPGDPSASPQPPSPIVKRLRLDVVKRLEFDADSEMEDPPHSSPPSSGITPPSSPRVPAELWGDGHLVACNPVLKRPPVLEDYISVTSTAGHRAYLLLRPDPVGIVQQRSFQDVWRRAPRQLGLLGVSIASLKEQVDSERREQLLAEASRLSDTLGSLRSEMEEEVPSSEVAEEPANQGDHQDTGQHRLWVDAFAPKRYTELLSDDFTNRCLLKWLKLWDPVVFGRERPAQKPMPSVESARASKEAPGAAGKWKSHEQVLEEMLDAELEPSGRPRQKVALLCGPPGLGKTTLAHVIAQHAGYCVVEMNASDDRSPEAFRTRIEAATQMESVLGSGGKPNCLIIDEIDGAPMAAIQVLLGVLDRKGPPETEAGAAGGTRHRRAEGALLMRPIICICNDQFTPSLRPLRQQAFLLQFPPTLPSRLVQRLQEIALRQGMLADPGALAALCQKTDNDIRACVNTLQFLHGRGKHELSIRAVQTVHVGMKDQRRGLFSVWQEIFQLPRAQRRQVGQDPALPIHTANGDLLSDQPSLTMVAQRFQHVLRVAASAGEHEKVVQGLFENFLRMRLRDPGLGGVCVALDWLAFDDLLQRAALHGQSFQLLRYPSFLPAAFHVLFASSHVPRITFPSSQQEAQSRTARTQNLIQTLVSGIVPSARSWAGPQTLVLDTLCLLLDILAPKLRPVSTQLFSTREKEQLASLVGTMLAYSLTYRQERTPEGQYTYRLEPNVEDVCRFPQLPARKPLTYQAKQLIAHEIEVEKMRRAEAKAGPQVSGAVPGVQSGAGVKGSLEQRLEHILQRTALEEQPEKDFFGRVVQRKAATPASTGDPAPETESAEWRMGKAVGRSDVWFRFKEGVSNAVRRSLYIRDLL